MRAPLTTELAGSTPERRAEPAPAPPVMHGPASVLALQQSAGNAAVARMLSAQPATIARAKDPPELPITGDASIMLLEQERHFPLDLPDLSDFDIGKGELSTGPIELGDGIEAQLDVGAHNPPRLADASVHLSPVEANIAASVIAERREAREAAGIYEAAVGGVVGGIAGSTPFGLLAGLNPISGAEKGGVIGGRIGEAAGQWAIDRFALEATLISGVLSGRLKLLYSPYIRLRLGVSLLSKVFDVNATLQTQMGLELVPSLSVAGSKVGLHFADGKLARSEFSLALKARIEAALDIAGMLQIGATILNFIDNDSSESEKRQAHDDPGLLTLNILDTDVFPIVEGLRGAFEADTKLDLLKASPLDLVKKRFSADDEAITKLVAGGMKGNMAPAVKKSRAGKQGGKGPAPEPPSDGRLPYHKGTFGDPIPIIWFKPTDAYPDSLVHHGGDDVRKFPHRRYADGLEAGVDAEWWPWTGKKFKKGTGKRADGGTTTGQADLEEEFREHDVELPGGVAQIDHVMDDFLGGPDQPENLWPLKTQHNRDSGLKHGHQGVRYQDPDGPAAQNPTAAHNVKAGAWFIITQQLQPGDALPPDGAPEFLG